MRHQFCHVFITKRQKAGMVIRPCVMVEDFEGLYWGPDISPIVQKPTKPVFQFRHADVDG